nr:hypothetical protein Iba_chr07bCG9490 [Ipomoea batatas]
MRWQWRFSSAMHDAWQWWSAARLAVHHGGSNGGLRQRRVPTPGGEGNGQPRRLSPLRYPLPQRSSGEG